MYSIPGSSGESNYFPLDKRRDRTPVPHAQLRDRRSATRPIFVNGWRKAFGNDAPQSLPKSAVTQASRIDIWVANTHALYKAESCLKLLTEDDWIPLLRLQDPTARYNAAAARVMLRLALSRTADRHIAPSDWQFGKTAHDKPVVTNAFSNINFSVSHADPLAAVAISQSFDVGIDIEKVDQTVSDGVVSGFSHADEQSSVGSLPSPQKTREFIRLWTLKEAYSKMIGLGHSLDFKTIKFLHDLADLDGSNIIFNSNCPTRFESFFVAAGHTLFHASLAARCPKKHAMTAEIQIINLVNTKGADEPFVAPLCW